MIINLVKNTITILFSLFFSFLICEIILRLLDIGYGNAPLESSRNYHHVHPKSYKFLMHQPKGEYGGFYVYYEKNRFRVEDDSVRDIFSLDNDNSIVFLGDSFTEGNQVAYTKTFVSKIGQMLDTNVLNLGVSSYSPALYLLQMKDFVKNLDSKRLILQIYRNDFKHDISYMEKAILNKNEIIAIDAGSTHLLKKIARRSYLARFLRKSQLTILEVMESDYLIEKKDTSKIQKEFLYEQNVTDAQIENTVEIIKQIQQIASVNGKTLYVFMIPSKALSKMQNCCSADKIYTKFKKKIIESSINFLDVSKHFQSLENQSDLYFEIDPHLNEFGHHILADALIKELNTTDHKF